MYFGPLAFAAAMRCELPPHSSRKCAFDDLRASIAYRSPARSLQSGLGCGQEISLFSPPKSNQLLLVTDATRPKIPSKFVRNFFSYHADRQTNRGKIELWLMAQV